MSFWMKAGVAITDFEVFKTACEKYGIQMTELNEKDAPVIAGCKASHDLYDPQSGGHWYLTKQGGGFRLVMDNDSYYNPLTRRLGQNGGKLMRDYAVGAVRKGVARSGGMVNLCQERPDGSIVMKISA